MRLALVVLSWLPEKTHARVSHAFLILSAVAGLDSKSSTYPLDMGYPDVV